MKNSLINTEEKTPTQTSNNEINDEDLQIFDMGIPLKGKTGNSKKKNKKGKNNPTEEEINEKQKLIFKILKYQDNKRFSPILKKLRFSYNYSTLNSKSISILNEILQRIYVNINNDGIDKLYDMLVQQSASTFEKSVSSFYNIEGFQDSLLCDETFLNLLERYKIEHSLPDIPLGVQMSLVITKHMLLCNAMSNIKNNQLIHENKNKINIDKNYKIKKPKIDKSILE